MTDSDSPYSHDEESSALASPTQGRGSLFEESRSPQRRRRQRAESPNRSSYEHISLIEGLRSPPRPRRQRAESPSRPSYEHMSLVEGLRPTPRLGPQLADSVRAPQTGSSSSSSRQRPPVRNHITEPALAANERRGPRPDSRIQTLLEQQCEICKDGIDNGRRVEKCRRCVARYHGRCLERWLGGCREEGHRERCPHCQRNWDPE